MGTSDVTHPHIALIAGKGFPEGPLDEFLDAVRADTLEIESASIELGGPYAILEWLVPTAVTAYIGKSYFDGFLGEMGKDHYHVLKRGLLGLSRHLFGPSSIKVSLVGTSGKVSKRPVYSLSFSILAEAGPQLRFKFLFRDDTSEAQLATAIDLYLDFLERHHSGSLDQETMARLQNARPVGGTIGLVMDLSETEVLPLDYRENGNAGHGA